MMLLMVVGVVVVRCLWLLWNFFCFVFSSHPWDKKGFSSHPWDEKIIMDIKLNVLFEEVERSDVETKLGGFV